MRNQISMRDSALPTLSMSDMKGIVASWFIPLNMYIDINCVTTLVLVGDPSKQKSAVILKDFKTTMTDD